MAWGAWQFTKADWDTARGVQSPGPLFAALENADATTPLQKRSNSGVIGPLADPDLIVTVRAS
jgi:hypothetical protein